MLRTYTFGDSTWGFTGEVRSFADPDSIIPRWTPPVEQDPDEFVEDIVLSGPHNGVPYYYSVTRFDRVYLAGEIFAVFPDSQPGDDAFYRAIDRGFYRRPGSEEPTPIYPGGPARTETPHLGGVTVVPNPYEAGKVPWELGGSRHVEFRQLPEEATIRIYTVAGDFVRELKKGRGIHGESVNVVSWDLMNSSGREVSSGIYVFRIETPTGELEHGYFAIIL